MSEKQEKFLDSYQISTGKKSDGRLHYEKPCGIAKLVEHESKPHYSIKFWLLPDTTFYLCKSKTQANKYTIFAKKVGEENIIFQNPIGWGYLSEDLKTHIEMQLLFPRQKVFLSLFPLLKTKEKQ